MRIQADCVELRRTANEMREQALGLAILGRACSGFAYRLPDMPGAYRMQAAEVLVQAHKALEDVAYDLVADSGEVYARADWMAIAGLGGPSGWLYQFLGPGFDDRSEMPSRVEWERIVDATIAAIGMGVDGSNTARKTAGFISKVWRWSDDPIRRSLASRQIRQAGRVTKWATSKWLRRGGWALTILDGVITFQRYNDTMDDTEAFVRTTAEVGTPALAGWGAGLLCMAGLAGSPFSGGATVVACAGAGAVAGAATDSSGLGEWIGQRTEEEFLNPEEYYIQIDVPPEGWTYEEYWDGMPSTSP